MHPKLNVFNSANDAPHALPANSIVCDLFQVAVKKIADGSVDAVIIDPPYTDGITDALPNHKIQTKIDIDLVMREAYRILKPNGFFVFFGQMPTVLSWLNSATNVFRYKEHITWAKRTVTSPYLPIVRSKEEIFIYCKGKPKYHETQAKFEDLRTPAMHFGLVELSTIKRQQSSLQRRVKQNAYNLIYFQGLNIPIADGVTPCCGKKVVDNSMETLPQIKGQTEEEFSAAVEGQRTLLLSQIDSLDKGAKLDIAHGDHDKTLRYTSKDREKSDEQLMKKTGTNDPWRANKYLNAKYVLNEGREFHEAKSQKDFEDLEKKQKLQIAHGRANDEWLEKKMPNAALERQKDISENLDRSAKEYRPLSEKRNDGLIQDAYQKTLEKRADFDEKSEFKRAGYQDPASNDKIYNKGREIKTAHRYESKHWCNVSNVWSFLPEPEDVAAAQICTMWSYLSQNQTKMGADGENWKHPTVKPVLLFERLIALLCAKPTDEIKPLVVDFFLGSGTLAVAAAKLGVDFIGIELQKDYFDMSVARTQKAIDDKNNPQPEIKPKAKSKKAAISPEVEPENKNQLGIPYK